MGRSDTRDPAASTADVRSAALWLLAWLEERDWRGHDPFDLLRSPLAAPLRPFRWPSVAWTQIGRRLALDLRALLRVPALENPKALALGVLGCLDLADAGEEGARDVARRLTARLLSTQGEEGGWGYPFPWANRHFNAPAGTPTGVVTAFVTSALLEAARRGGVPRGSGPEALHASVAKAAGFVHLRLRRLPTAAGALLSYTPLDHRGVHNASLLAAAVMARGSTLPGGNPRWAEEARLVAAATLRAQRPDGSWPYGVSRRDRFVDSYHTGYVLAALAEVDSLIGLDGAAEAVRRGRAYWRSAFLTGPAVGPAPARPWPVDLHAVAQAILMLVESSCGAAWATDEDAAADRREALRLAGWALTHARRPDGAFVHTWSPGRVNAIVYLRWVQAWMFRALAALVTP